jgi:serine/threonine protein kinase
MVGDPTTHPNTESLAAFSLGKLDDNESVALVEHLETCAVCQQTVEETPPDTFLEALHAAGPVSEGTLPRELANHPCFRIVRELGRGGMGIVYLAEHRLMERKVAIKVINKALVENPQAVERFHREIRTAAQLDHPNIVRAYDAEEADDLHMLVMEYVEGLSLADVLQRTGPLPVADACSYVCQAALALQHAFTMGVVHRDLKPHNLMLLPEKRIIKVLDFGLARLASERPQSKELTAENIVMGTPEYLAPEQAADAREADIRADIYSLGCTLYALLVGRPPFRERTALLTVLAHREQEAVPLHDVRSDIPAELSAIVARMIAKEPARRYQTPGEVAGALAPFLNQSQNSPTARTVSPLEDGTAHAVALLQEKQEQPWPRPDRRRWRAVGLTAAATVVGLGLVIGIKQPLWPGQALHYLSDMEEFEVQVIDGPPGVPRFAKKGNLGFGGGEAYHYGRISVNGQASPNGLSMNPYENASGSVKYRLGKTAHAFLALVALDDSAGGAGLPPGVGPIPTPLTFKVLGDGELLWQSQPVNIRGTVQECSVNVTGVDVLELRIDCPGSGANAYAVWLEPRVLLK